MDHIAAQLAEQSFSVVPQFLPETDLTLIRADLLTLRDSGKMKRASLGKERVVSENIRRDEIFWLDRANPVRIGLLEKMTGLMSELNRRCFLGLRSFEGHYAHYPAGGFYSKHLDKFRDASDREVSVVLYLNQNWKPADGGELRLHTAKGAVDIAPVGGTLACFLSGEIEHEVLESHAPRLSFTGWFKT